MKGVFFKSGIPVTPIFPIAFFHWVSMRTRRLHALSEIHAVRTSAPFLDTCCRLSLAFTSFHRPLIWIVFVSISFVTFAFLCVPRLSEEPLVFIALAAWTDFPACIRNSDSFVSGTDWHSLSFFCICCSVHCNSRLNTPNKMQQYAHIYLQLNYSTYYGCPSRPSSGVHKTSCSLWYRS